MSNRRSLFSLVAVIACMGLAFTTSFGDDLLGKHKGGGGHGGGGSSSGGQRGGGGSGGGHSSGDGGGRHDNGGGGGPTRSDPPRRGGGGNEGGRSGGGNSGGGDTRPDRSGGNQGGGTEVRSGGTRIYIPPSNRNNNDNGNQGVDLLGKRGSRGGNTNYGTNSNARFRDRNSGPVNIGRAPIDIVRGSLATQVRRADTIKVGNSTIRFGYTHYDYRWCDDNFYYPHYVFDPYQYQSYCSPWYYYPQLPPYFMASRCYVGTYVWSPFVGVSYNWYPPTSNNNYYNQHSYSEFDYAVDDIVSAFENTDRRAVSRLVPRNGRVAILIEGKYAYSMNADDFYDTLLDATSNTRTRDYKILDVQTSRDGAAVWARHDFEDPWGRRETVYHYYRLELEGRDWVIREFGTSENRW